MVVEALVERLTNSRGAGLGPRDLFFLVTKYLSFNFIDSQYQNANHGEIIKEEGKMQKTSSTTLEFVLTGEAIWCFKTKRCGL